MRKHRAKKILEILSLAQIADQQSQPLWAKLLEKEQELRFPFQSSMESLQESVHLVNEMLNLFERCYGILIEQTMPIRQATLSLQQQDVYNAIVQTLCLWKKYQPLFSFSAMKAVNTCFYEGIQVDPFFISLPSAILTARAIYSLKKDISKDLAWKALSLLLSAEASQKTFSYVFGTESHFEKLFDEFNQIYEQYKRVRGTVSGYPSVSLAYSVSEKIDSVQNGTQEPHEEISSSVEVKFEVTEPVALLKRSFTEVVKPPLPVLKEREKQMLSLYAQSLDVSPPADFLLRRDGVFVSLRKPNKPPQSITAAAPRLRLSKTQSMVNLVPRAVVRKQSASQGQSTLTKAQSTTNLSVFAKTAKKGGFFHKAWDKVKGGASLLLNRYTALPLEDIQEQETVEPESAGVMSESAKKKKKKNKKKQNKEKVITNSKQDDKELLAQAIAQCTLTTQQRVPVTDRKRFFESLLVEGERLLSQAKAFQLEYRLSGKQGGDYFTCCIEYVVGILKKLETFISKMKSAKEEKEFKDFKKRTLFI